MFVHLFEGLESRCAPELAAVRTQAKPVPICAPRCKPKSDFRRAQFPSSAPRTGSEPLVVHWEDGMALLREAGETDFDPLDDLSTVTERRLGELVAQKFGVDLYILDRFPASVRPFYTMPCPDDNRYSNSYDIFLRGQEICSGAQRIHDVAMLEERIAQKGVPVGGALKSYVDSMRYGMPPHGGGGIGMERLVFLYLGLDNVRKASMFPRDPSRCTP